MHVNVRLYITCLKNALQLQRTNDCASLSTPHLHLTRTATHTHTYKRAHTAIDRNTSLRLKDFVCSLSCQPPMMIRVAVIAVAAVAAAHPSL